MAKLNRESKLREKRAQKQARKAARKLTSASNPAEGAAGTQEPGSASAQLEALLLEDAATDSDAEDSASPNGAV